MISYELAEDINSKLNYMSTTLKELISKLNNAQNKNSDNDNPVKFKY